jgi:hypothetical protein
MVSGVFGRDSDQSLSRKVDAQFERGSDGKMVFYLDKNRRAGYVIDPPEREQALRNYARQREKLGQLLAGFATAVISFFGYVIIPRYPWWLGLTYCFGALAIFLFASWLWLRSATAGLTRIGKTPAPSPKFWITLAIVAATLVFISIYPPSAELSSTPKTIAFYPDIGDPGLMMVLGAVATYFVDKRSAQLTAKVGSVRYGVTLAICAGFAIIGFTLTAYTLTSSAPKLLVTATGLKCDKDRIDWQDVSALSLVSDYRTHEFVRLAIDPARINNFRFSPTVYQHGYFSCEIDGTGAGYLAVYNAIEAAWKNRKL